MIISASVEFIRQFITFSETVLVLILPKPHLNNHLTKQPLILIIVIVKEEADFFKHFLDLN